MTDLSSFTSPWRGEVASQSASEGWREGVNREASGRTAEIKKSPHPGVLRKPTLPLQGRVKKCTARHDVEG
jgi:hypothetical protein